MTIDLSKNIQKVSIFIFIQAYLFRIITKTPSNTKISKNSHKKHQTRTHAHTKHDLITWCKMLQNKIDFVLGVWMCADECRYVMVDADG